MNGAAQITWAESAAMRILQELRGRDKIGPCLAGLWWMEEQDIRHAIQSIIDREFRGMRYRRSIENNGEQNTIDAYDIHVGRARHNEYRIMAGLEPLPLELLPLPQNQQEPNNNE